MVELAGLFAASFLAATLFPLPSEAALFAYLQLYPERAVLAVLVASVGNTAGGMTTYCLGRLVPQKRKIPERALHAIRKYGAAATFLAWLPVIGDALALAAGWLRLHWLPVLCFMAAGRLARYVAVATLA